MSCMIPQVKTISFEEIVKGRDASVRVTEDGLLYAVDLVMVVTGSNNDDAGKTLRRLPHDIFHSDKFSERQLSNRGGRPTKLVSFKDAIELVMVLPGKVAKETRTNFQDIIRRYMAGDERMHAELDANAASSSPIAQMARASLAGEKVHVDAVEVGLKRRREELELQKLELEVKFKRLEYYRDLEDDIKRISDPANYAGMEERARLMLKDRFMNQLLLDGQKQMQIANEADSNENKPISIASVATELGYRPSSSDAKRIGMDLRKRYMAKHDGKSPPKHEQLCDGRVTWVNSYTEKDRELVEASIRSYFSCGGSSASDESM